MSESRKQELMEIARVLYEHPDIPVSATEDAVAVCETVAYGVSPLPKEELTIQEGKLVSEYICKLALEDCSDE